MIKKFINVLKLDPIIEIIAKNDKIEDIVNDERLEKYHKKLKGYSAIFIEDASSLETQLEWTISSYFSRNVEDYTLFNHLIFSDTELGFFDKITMFEKLGYFLPEFKDDLSDVILQLNQFRRIRNTFAHASMGIYEKDISRVEKEILFFVVEKGEYIQKSYTFDYIESVLKKFSNLNIRLSEAITYLKNKNKIYQGDLKWSIHFDEKD